jgi:hypothetical protein
MKTAPALHSLLEDDPETKTEGATNDMRRTSTLALLVLQGR